MDVTEQIKAVVVQPRQAHVAFPGVQCIDRPDWHQLTTPALREGGLNGVSLAILGESDVDRVIDETIRGYEDLGLRFRWTVGPDSRPLDLGSRLEARGLKPVSIAGMMATDGEAPSSPEINVRVVGPENLHTYNDVMSEGWGITSPALSDYNSHVLRESPNIHPFFIAEIDGKGVGVASYFTFSKSVHLLGGVVLPEFRKRGVYRAMVQARQEHARKRSISLATCHAMESSAPILTSLGFQTVCSFTSYGNLSIPQSSRS